MEKNIELPEELSTDEAVSFIAHRHNVTPQQLLTYYLSIRNATECQTPEKKTIPLETNETEILKELYHRCRQE